MSYDLTLAHKCAVMADIAYAYPSEGRNALFDRGWYNVRWFDHAGTQAYMAHRRGMSIVAIRGTSELSDLMDDKDIRWHPSSFGGRVHAGFWTHALRIQSSLIDWLEEREGPVYLCGHSLGAAATAQVALWLTRWRKEDPLLRWHLAGVYLYGCPKLGDARFTAAYDARVGEITYPHRNNNDPVCWLPWRFGQYKVLARRNVRYFTADGRTIVNPSLAELVQDGRRGALHAVLQMLCETIQKLPQHQWRLGASLWAAFRRQLNEFDHCTSEYIRLTRVQAERQGVKEAEW